MTSLRLRELIYELYPELSSGGEISVEVGLTSQARKIFEDSVKSEMEECGIVMVENGSPVNWAYDLVTLPGNIKVNISAAEDGFYIKRA